MFTPIEDCSGREFRNEVNERLDNDRGDIEKQGEQIQGIYSDMENMGNKMRDIAYTPCFY